MPRVKPIRQHDQSDCGAACLSSIAAAYGYHQPISKIRDMASTEKNGTNVMGLVEAAEKMASIKDKYYSPISRNVKVYKQLYKEYKKLHDYFGRGENDVMKKLKSIRNDTKSQMGNDK